MTYPKDTTCFYPRSYARTWTLKVCVECHERRRMPRMHEVCGGCLKAEMREREGVSHGRINKTKDGS